MNSSRVLREKKKLDDAFLRADAALRVLNANTPDLEFQADVAKHLCVLVSAFLENSIRYILADYVRSRSSATVAAYVEERLDYFYNAKMTKILELVGSFDSSWRAALESAIDTDLKDAADTIVENKNLVAHGKDSQITLARIKQYYGRALDLLEHIETHCC